MYKKELLATLAIIKNIGHFQLEKQNELHSINLKEDRSPVTEIDQESEERIKRDLLELFPEDGFLGEESGEVKSKNGRRWIVDPLDGTRPYIHKIPTFSTLIALEENGEIVLGVVALHALGETYWATKGGGAFCNGKRISVSTTAQKVEDAMGSALGLTESAHTSIGQALYQSMQKWEYVYGFMDAYSYMAVASGKLDMTVSLIDTAWDRAPAAIIVKEAGGKVSSASGEETIYGEHFIVSNGVIHNELLQDLNS